MKKSLATGTAAVTMFFCVVSLLMQTAFPDDSTAKIEKQRVLRHVVMFKFKESASKSDVTTIVEAFAKLPEKIDSIKDFEWGTNNSPEGLNKDLTHCFIITFADETGREKYLPHEAHKAFVEILKPHMADVCVIDFWNKPAPEKVAK